MLADESAWTDGQGARLVAELHVLRRLAEGGERKDLATRAKRRAAHDDDVRMHHDAVAKLDMRTDQAKGADLDVCAKLSKRIDHRGRMDVSHT